MDVTTRDAGAARKARASSTTFDAVVFVLLVGAAIGVLAGVSPGGSDGPSRLPDETGDVLATSTTEITFERSAAIERANLLRLGGDAKNVSVERRSHGTYAELLAAAAVANPRFESRPLTGTGGNFEDAVVAATERVLPTDEANVQVRATWRAYAGSGLNRTIVVGERPPGDADVSVATVTVPSGFPSVTARVNRPGVGYETVANAVARSVVAGLFPADRTRDALSSEGPDRAVVAHRYRTASGALGASTDSALATGNVSAANRRLVEALAPRIEARLNERFASPQAAAGAVALRRVRIAVRTWSP